VTSEQPPEAPSPETTSAEEPTEPTRRGRPRSEDITRRAALIATAVAVPVVVVLLVVVNLATHGGKDRGGSGSTPVAELSGSRTPARDEKLPVLTVPTPAVTPAADLACPVLMKQMPLELDGEKSRLVKSDSPYVYAWGDPAVVLVCGADPPAGYVVGASAIQIDQVQWYVDTTSSKNTTIWTTVDRNVPVQVQVPASADSASVTALGKLVGTAIPYVDPSPAPAPGSAAAPSTGG
jgi:Protein of unknown function (DUF3515)